MPEPTQTQATELELFIRRAYEVGNYHVIEFYSLSWLPYKQQICYEQTSKEERDE